MPIFAAENVGDWRGKSVIDPSDAKIGELEAVHVDTASDEPALATVKIGTVGWHRLMFLPLVGATVRPATLRVQVDKKLVGDGLSIDTDGELTAVAEAEVFTRYALPVGNDGVRRAAGGEPGE